MGIPGLIPHMQCPKVSLLPFLSLATKVQKRKLRILLVSQICYIPYMGLLDESDSMCYIQWREQRFPAKGLGGFHKTGCSFCCRLLTEHVLTCQLHRNLKEIQEVAQQDQHQLLQICINKFASTGHWNGKGRKFLREINQALAEDKTYCNRIKNVRPLSCMPLKEPLVVQVPNF